MEGRTRIGLNLTEKGISAMCWGDSGKVHAVGDGEFPMEPGPRVGISTQSGLNGADRRARFADFLISSRPLEERKELLEKIK